MHALLRDEVLLRLSVMRRQALHARIAEALGARGGDAQTLVRRAQHMTEALPVVTPAAVFDACTAAARDAERRWDWDMAAQQWGAARSALQMQPGADQAQRDELLLARMDALVRAGRNRPSSTSPTPRWTMPPARVARSRSDAWRRVAAQPGRLVLGAPTAVTHRRCSRT